jgi:hypothetical protein
MSANTAKTGEKRVHPLITKTAHGIRDWGEWLDLWEAAESFQTLNGLLHVGFSVNLPWRTEDRENGKDWHDRVLFYLQVADRWKEHGWCVTESEANERFFIGLNEKGEGVHKNAGELRGKLSEKAFAMLAGHFFNAELWDLYEHRKFFWIWNGIGSSERLLAELAHFFRLDGSAVLGSRMVNLGWRDQSHHEVRAEKFLKNFATYLWEWQTGEPWTGDEEKKRAHRERVAAHHARLGAAKLWVVESLDALHQLSFLERWMDRLDKPVLGKLQEIAMRTELKSYSHPVKDHRKVATLEEACYAGSDAAWLLARHKLLTREGKRLRSIQEAQEERDKAEQKIKKLSAQAT